MWDAFSVPFILSWYELLKKKSALKLWSLSAGTEGGNEEMGRKDVYERRTSAASGFFSFLGSDFA